MCEIPTTDPHRQRSFRETIGGYFNHGHVPAATPVADRNDRVGIIITRDEHADWHVSFTNEHGTTSGNFGDTANMLAGLFDYLYECGAGNWTAVENEEPK